MGKRSLVALDTQHIKKFVLATDKLKEIRGASSILDRLNRWIMNEVAQDFQAEPVYTNGGSGLFLVPGDEKVATKFGQRIQQAYRRETQDGAEVAFAVQEIPDHVKDARTENIQETLDILYYRLAVEANRSPELIALSSHPFLRPCDACGLRYAETRDTDERRDPASQNNRYCSVCKKKREEDDDIKDGIYAIVREWTRRHQVTEKKEHPFVWECLISKLPKTYDIPAKTERPPDFNELRGLSGGKDYLALIYADGNGMGQVMQKIGTLDGRRERADLIDDAVYEAISTAVAEHLAVIPGENGTPPRFPFDLLLVGGDDIMMVTPASVAFDVALTIAKKFRKITIERDPEKKGHTLSIGVVLAPVKYPFGLLQDLADSTLKHAKNEGAKMSKTSANEGAKMSKTSAYGDTFINFMTVTGSTSLDFKKVYAGLHEKDGKFIVDGREKDVEFYATLRPYTVEELEILLAKIREGKKLDLGRTKLHQVREAVLKMNLTSSVTEGLGVLRNWRQKQQKFVLDQVYTLGEHYQERYKDDARPETLFPRVTFPWFADGDKAYRTSLLDFVELYDFVERKGEANADEK